MKLLVSGNTRDVAELIAADERAARHLGALVIPNERRTRAALERFPGPWAADNGAFAGFDAGRFLGMLDEFAGLPGCLFVACPDVVADSAGTLELFERWRDEIAVRGYSVALVLQDGQESRPVPWDRLDAVFVGGSTAFKLSPEAAELCGEARRLGKHVHMGRVNSRQRMRTARQFGVDSIDGGMFSRFRRVNLPKALRWLDQVTAERSLFAA